MARRLNVPAPYQSPIISAINEARQQNDPRKQDLSPSILDFGPVRFKIARHFGFCFGVNNAIDIAYRALDQNPGKRVYLLSEVIHNPRVNQDLAKRGVRFVRNTSGLQLIPFDDLKPDDIVIIPAFGTSVEVQKELARRGIDTQTYDTTCPFVEKVWRRSTQIGTDGYSIVVHGKRYHEETRATISHAKSKAPVVVIRNIKEAVVLAGLIRGDLPITDFFDHFSDRHSKDFDPDIHLQRIGVVNQTTMLATETQAITDLLRQAMIDRYGEKNLLHHFADTRDTLCYATNENQDATKALITAGGDLAIVVGGYNSSNTSHLVELCEKSVPTFFIKDADEILSPILIRHFYYPEKTLLETKHWLPDKQPINLLLTSGASCPDALLDEVLLKILGCFPDAYPIEHAITPFVEGIS